MEDKMLDIQPIITEIAQNLHNARPENYEKANLEYKLSDKDAWNAFSGWYVINGKNVSVSNPAQLKETLLPLLNNLRENMQQSNIEDKWTKFTLSIDEKRMVHTSFEYGEQDL